MLVVEESCGRFTIASQLGHLACLPAFSKLTLSRVLQFGQSNSMKFGELESI